MKTLQKVGVVYLFTTIMALGIYGCCVRELKITGTQTIRMSHLDNALQNFRDTVKGPFAILVEYDVERTASSILDAGLMQTAYAWSCDYSNQNDFDEATLRISCDRAFLLDGVRIEPHSDFIRHEALLANTYFQQFMAHCSIYFRQAFLDRAVFERDVYTFRVYVETTDGLQLEKSISLFLDL